MKRILPLLVFSLVSISAFSQHWYSQDNRFIYPQKWFGKYLPPHVAGFRTAVTQRWQPVDGIWINTTRHAHQYVGANPLPQAVQIDIWNATTNTWKASSIVNYNFTNSILQNEVIQTANASGVYSTANKENYIYGVNNRLEQNITQGWRASDNTWVNAYRDTNAYKNNQLAIINKQQWTTLVNVFYDDARDSLTYDANGRLAINYQQAWISPFWRTAQRDLMTYDATGKRSELRREFTKDITVNSYDTIFRWTYTYNAQNNITVLLRQQWNVAAKIWQNHTRVTNIYDANGKITQELVEVPNSASWTNVTRTLYDAATPTTELLNENDVSIHPNPTANFSELEIKNADLVVQKIHLFNTLGQCINSQSIAPHSTHIPLIFNNLSNGIYLLKIETTQGFIVKKWEIFKP